MVGPLVTYKTGEVQITTAATVQHHTNEEDLRTTEEDFFFLIYEILLTDGRQKSKLRSSRNMISREPQGLLSHEVDELEQRQKNGGSKNSSGDGIHQWLD